MNPFLVTPSLVLNRVEAVFKAHDRLFEQLHRRMDDAPATSAHRAITPTYVRTRPTPLSSSGETFYSGGSMSEPRRRSNVSSSGGGGGSGLHRTNTLVREGIVPQRTSGLLNEAPISPKTSTNTEERRSRIVSADGSARKPRSRSSADPAASPIPFAFTRSLGSSWYQVSAPDSGNATLRGGNHSGNGCLALRAGSARHFMLAHFNLHALNANLASYDLRFQANWDGPDEQLHVVLCFRAADDFCVLSLRPQRGAALLRHCRTSPSDDPAALANATLLGEFLYEPLALAPGESVVFTARLSLLSLLCTLQRAPAAAPPPPAGASSLPLPGDVATVFDGPSPASGDLSRGCVAGVLVTCASRLSVRDWTVRLRYAAPASSAASAASAATPGATAAPTALMPTPLGLSAAQRPPATPAQRPSAPPLQLAQRSGPPATLRPSLRPGAAVATPAPAAAASAPVAADVAALPQHVRDALGPERAARLAALPFERDIVAAILADLLLPQTFQRVSFEEIAGLEEAKRLLSEAVVLPALLPSLFAGSALRLPWRGILLFGPPGTGKTLLARAVASLLTTLPGAQTGAAAGAAATAAVGGAFFSCSAATLVSKWRGDSEKLVKCLFSVARCVAPSVVFLDEVDALVSQRGGGGEHEASRRMKTEFFAQMDGVLSGDADTRVVVLATTNCPWDLDAAVLRRFEKRIYVPLPDAAAREAHFVLCLRQLRSRDAAAAADDASAADDNVETRRWATRLAAETQGFSSADIVAVCREAAMTPLRRLLAQHSLQDLAQALATQPAAAQPAAAEVTPADVAEALRRVRQSVPQTSLARFDAWNELYGSALAPSAAPPAAPPL
eukprot:gene6634-4780_t